MCSSSALPYLSGSSSVLIQDFEVQMGYSSDSDIEEIEVICDKKSSNGKQGSKWFDAGELLDIEDDEVTLCGIEPGRSEKVSSNKKQKENGVKRLEKKSAGDSGSSDDEVMSLLSLSPPSSPQAGKKKKPVELFELCSSDEEGKKNMAGSSKESYADVSARFADDFFADAEFATLADYLADVRKEKEASTSKFVGSSASSSVGVSSGSGSLPTTSQSQTSTGDTGEPKSYRVGVGAGKKGSRKKPQNATTANGTKKKTKDQENGTVATASNSTERVKGKVGDAFKTLVVQIPEVILTDPLAAKLLEREVNFAILETPPIPGCILFEYNVPYNVIGRDFKAQPQVLKEMAEDVLVIFPIEDHLVRLKTEIDCLNRDVPPTTGSLTEWLTNLQNLFQKKNITLFVQGLEAYLRKIQKATQKEYRDRILNIDEPTGNAGKARKTTKQKERIVLTRDDIRYVLVGVQLLSSINFRCYENVSELADHLYHFGRAIAKVPEKKEKAAMEPTDFDIHSVDDNNGGIAIDVDGKGMRSLWVKQLCQFSNVGQERALAISKIYNCPKKLCEAYSRCSSVEEGQNMLTEVKFTSGVGPLAKKRRLGPEASRIIHKFFTATDGLQELN